jgi:Ni/Co efflux regulator RcnB
MHVMFRLPPLVTGVLLLAVAPFGRAESPLPDPIAPAVIGPPLDQIRPARPGHHKAAAARSKARRVVATSQVHAHPHAQARAHEAFVVAPTSVPPPPVSQQAIEQILQQVPRQAAQPVAQTVAQQPFGPRSYFSTRDQELVRRYYAAHPVSGQVAQWKVGEPIPPKSVLTGEPDDLRAALSALPAGHQYVEVDGDVVLVAVQSRVVVDGISRDTH